ncbi:uncharacterized protein [Argopecten irradians]|uniref:uncharacterized protein n=1 Tax=Argopecten irradians TaxID=31199 RepID=UPI0037228DEB
MIFPLRLFVGVFLVASATLTVAWHPQHQPLSDVLFRRQVQPAFCSSYYTLTRTIGRQVSRRFHSIVDKLFRENDGVTQQMLETASTDLCNLVHIAAVNVSQEITDCNNFPEITTIMGVFSGICLYNGDKTRFLEEMLDGVEVVNYRWHSLCSEQASDVLIACRSSSSSIRESGMGKGPDHYKALLLAQERCIAGGFLQTDVSACGDVQSLTNLAHIMNLFYALAPGVTFESSDFEPEINS